MRPILSEDEKLLRDSAEQFIKAKAPITHFRQLRDSNSETGFSEDLWQAMAELGWQGLLVPEELGGHGLGFCEFAQILEQCGKTLCPSPLISNSTIATYLLVNGGNRLMVQQWLEGLITGTQCIGLAHCEKRSDQSLTNIETIVTKEGDDYFIEGQKTLVLNAFASDAFIVSCKDSVQDELFLFLVPADDKQITLEKQVLLDGQVTGLVTFNKVKVQEQQKIGVKAKRNDAANLLQQALDLGTVALCAEMLGGMQAALDLAVDYLCTREQFGRKIGSFQALQHRASRLYIELELARVAVRAACCAVDDLEDNRQKQKMISLAKASCSDSYLHIATEALQFFGGIGMTDEHDIGLYLKKARVSEQLFGDASWHRERWARLSGY